MSEKDSGVNICIVFYLLGEQCSCGRNLKIRGSCDLDLQVDCINCQLYYLYLQTWG